MTLDWPHLTTDPALLARHAAAFAYARPAVVADTKDEPPPPPPRVPCRALTDEEIPPEILSYVATARASGATVRVTYAQAGADRPQPPQGICGHCKNEVGLNQDGTCRAHNASPPRTCPGRGQPPAPGGICPECQRAVKIGQRGFLNAHTRPSVACDSRGEGPERILPPASLPPEITIVLRADWHETRWARGCWLDGKFEVAWVCDTINDTDGTPLGPGAKRASMTGFAAYLRG